MFLGQGRRGSTQRESLQAWPSGLKCWLLMGRRGQGEGLESGSPPPPAQDWSLEEGPGTCGQKASGIWEGWSRYLKGKGDLGISVEGPKAAHPQRSCVMSGEDSPAAPAPGALTAPSAGHDGGSYSLPCARVGWADPW